MARRRDGDVAAVCASVRAVFHQRRLVVPELALQAADDAGVGPGEARGRRRIVEATAHGPAARPLTTLRHVPYAS